MIRGKVRLMTRALAILSLLVAGWTVRASDSLVWYPKARTFDLNIMSMPLEKFLGMVRAETGWEVMVENERCAMAELSAEGSRSPFILTLYCTAPPSERPSLRSFLRMVSRT